MIPKEIYHETIEESKTLEQNVASKFRQDYYILNRYKVIQCSDGEKVIKKINFEENLPIYYVRIEETYDVIKRAHTATGHGGWDRMTKHLSLKYANIRREAVELLKSYSATCQEKRKRPITKEVVVKPILSTDFGSYCQVDLIDKQSSPQVNYKWVMVYQCHLSFTSCDPFPPREQQK